MQSDVDTLARLVRERNDSFKHRVETQVDPFSIRDRLFEGQILWRRDDSEDIPKLVEVTQCLRDDADGHWEYVLTDMTRSNTWLWHENDVSDRFWDTGLRNDEPKPIHDGRIQRVYERTQ